MDNQGNHVMSYLDNNELLPEIDAAIDLVTDWADGSYYESKNKRLQEWSPDKFEIYKVISKIFTSCLINREVTYQALIGYVAGSIGCIEPLDRIKCTAEIIALCYQADLVDITRTSDNNFVITTEYSLEGIPELSKHVPEFSKPKYTENNCILGNRFKQHDKNICLDHVNRMNSIKLSLDDRTLNMVEELPGHKFETKEQLNQWNNFIQKSNDMYENVLNNNNEFYLKHNYDTRGRTYCEGYYINYQGSSYKKATIQLADKEIVKL